MVCPELATGVAPEDRRFMSKGKAPADQFYWGDWLRDAELQMACSATRGIWANALGHMWFAKTRGELVGTEAKLAPFLNATSEEFAVFLEEAEALGFCYVSRNSNGNLTIRNRRMYRKGKEQESNRLRQQRYYEKHKPNKDLTTPSPSPSPLKKKTYVEGCPEFQLSTLLFDLIKKRKPTFKKPNLQTWSKHIDLMIRVDNRSQPIVAAVIKWCQQNDFWQNNILSTQKLRVQFDQLELKMNQDDSQEKELTDDDIEKMGGFTL